MIDIKELIEVREEEDYQRDNFDDFLKKIKFSFSLPAIHIAGTNGKGSTASYISSIYKKAGYKVGLFTSPALFEINEMITVNGQPIKDEEIESIVSDKKKEIKKYELSAFEILTYVAFTYFENNKCDICVIECGMGGEIDATNVFEPVLSIITSISMEHTSFLGRSISEIALQKAGIIKDEVPVLLGNLIDEAKDVISLEAKEKESKIYTVGEPHQPRLNGNEYIFTYGVVEDIHIKSSAYYSVIDACLAIDAVKILVNKFIVTNENIKDGLSDVFMRCRMEKSKKDPLTFFDGAHNPEAMENLAKSLQKFDNPSKIRVLFACFKDKNLIQMLSLIGACTDSITLTSFPHPRARKEEDYFLFASDYEFINDPIEAYNSLKEKYPEDMILITGSLAFAAYMCKRLNNE